MLLLSSADFYQNNFIEISFTTTIRVSNGLDSDQDSRLIDPDRGSGSKLFAKAIIRQQKWPLVDKELIRSNCSMADAFFFDLC